MGRLELKLAVLLALLTAVPLTVVRLKLPTTSLSRS